MGRGDQGDGGEGGLMPCAAITRRQEIQASSGMGAPPGTYRERG